ncbi:hypothetical protein L0P14_25010, partial [Phocaeicola dorei]|uniref:hypothetical protein n=1 Tax=Phocaeicola dorei TaxID=357276 RepID=UPI001EDDE8BA
STTKKVNTTIGNKRFPIDFDSLRHIFIVNTTILIGTIIPIIIGMIKNITTASAISNNKSTF